MTTMYPFMDTSHMATLKEHKFITAVFKIENLSVSLEQNHNSGWILKREST